MWQKLKRSLFLQVLCALFLGVAVGAGFHDFSLSLKPLGDGFISLIKMLIAPIVFCVVVLGIYGANDIKKKWAKSVQKPFSILKWSPVLL